MSDTLLQDRPASRSENLSSSEMQKSDHPPAKPLITQFSETTKLSGNMNEESMILDTNGKKHKSKSKKNKYSPRKTTDIQPLSCSTSFSTDASTCANNTTSLSTLQNELFASSKSTDSSYSAFSSRKESVASGSFDRVGNASSTSLLTEGSEATTVEGSSADDSRTDGNTIPLGRSRSKQRSYSGKSREKQNSASHLKKESNATLSSHQSPRKIDPNAKCTGSDLGTNKVTDEGSIVKAAVDKLTTEDVKMEAKINLEDHNEWPALGTSKSADSATMNSKCPPPLSKPSIMDTLKDVFEGKKQVIKPAVPVVAVPRNFMPRRQS